MRRLLLQILLLLVILLSVPSVLGAVEIQEVEINGDPVIDGDSVDGVEPLNKIEFTILIANQLEAELDQVDVRIDIEDILDGRDITHEFGEFRLSDKEDKTLTFEFTVPVDVDDENEYEFVITVSAVDEQGNSSDDMLSGKLKINKADHRIIFEKFQVSPSSVSCGDVLTVKYAVVNLGSEEEKSAGVLVHSDKIGIRQYKEFSLSADPEDVEFRGNGEVKITIPNNVTISSFRLVGEATYAGGSVSDAKTETISVSGCLSAHKVDEVKEANVSMVPENKLNITEMNITEKQETQDNGESQLENIDSFETIQVDFLLTNIGFVLGIVLIMILIITGLFLKMAY